MTIREPLEFSIFPSLLLITTLFRLGINVSTTRNILSQGGSSGRVIAAFGDFVLRGNVVVGLIIFLIIVLMQFIVITKGAERVAEVAARFNLDAMPGKQMAIDADLSSGLINETQAKERRAKVQREADFYGAMDGATKIVKGDAVMSLITTAINLIGGSIIGIVQSGSSISAVLSTYSIATVGDGLVSQIPALLISTATGMIVTRAVSEGSLNEDVSKQFLAQPHAMIVSGAAVAVMAVIPGMPAVRTLVVAACLMGSGFYLSGKIKKEPQALSQMAMAPSTQLQDSPQAQAAAAKEEVSEEEYFKDVNIDNLFNEAKSNGLQNSYYDKYSFINEYVVRAVQVYFSEKIMEPDYVLRNIKNHQSIGYIYIEQIKNLFYKKDEYENFELFYKNEIVKYFTNLNDNNIG